MAIIRPLTTKAHRFRLNTAEEKSNQAESLRRNIPPVAATLRRRTKDLRTGEAFHLNFAELAAAVSFCPEEVGQNSPVGQRRAGFTGY